jgi:hypothetical protein
MNRQDAKAAKKDEIEPQRTQRPRSVRSEDRRDAEHDAERERIDPQRTKRMRRRRI